MGLAPYIHILARERILRSGSKRALRDFDARYAADLDQLNSYARGFLAILIVVGVAIVVWVI